MVGASTVSGGADALVHVLASDIEQPERAMERVRDEPNVDHARSAHRPVPPGRRPRAQDRSYRPRSRAMSISCTSVVPSPTSRIFESR